VIAVEPNDDMRRHGVQNSRGLPILWRAGSGEATGLDTGCADLVSMASSFHWVDFDRGMSEFARLLRRGGRFVALWNPRLIEVNPLLVEIEAHLASLAPGLKRVSSGRSGLTANLTERLWAHADFDDVVYLEGRHAQIMTPAQYLGVWRSVNDLQAQLGPNLFAEFLDYVEQRVAAEGTIEATYLTRAWSARRR
jgi:SAM-dependent methyltransferase